MMEDRSAVAARVQKLRDQGVEEQLLALTSDPCRDTSERARTALDRFGVIDRQLLTAMAEE